MNYEHVRELPRDEVDSELEEEWVRQTADDDIRGVSARKWADAEPTKAWRVGVAAAGLVRDDPLESVLRRRIAQELKAAPGVTDVIEEDREVWTVTGDPTGKDLATAAADAVDGLADQIRTYVDNLGR